MDYDLTKISMKNDGSHFFHLYKNEGKINDFRDRMKESIANLRQKNRQNNFDVNRAIDSTNQDDDKEVNNCFYQRGGKSKSRWCDLMMLAEWFLSVPEGFDNEYLMKLCPVGRHVLIVASKNKTLVYNKRGKMIASLVTNLPGGGPGRSGSAKSAVLDCIIDENLKVIYILDIISYLKQDFQLMTADSRFNWLDNYLRSELSSEVHCESEYHLEILPSVPCNKRSLESVFASKPSFPVDGVLFYWQEGTYISGSTYCATWLKPYMVPELLNITVHPDLMAHMPMEYEDYRADIIAFNHKYGFKADKNADKNGRMSPDEDKDTME